MKKCNKYAALLMLAALPWISSCSDDNAPKKPSREIVQIDVYKAETDAFHMQAQYQMTYDGKDRISSIRSNYNSQEVAYTYGNNNLTYRWEGNHPEIGVFVINFESELRNGRIQVGLIDYNMGTESNTFNYSYYYSPRGYVQDATYGGSQLFNYDWGKTNLVIKSRPSTYDAQYSYSDVTNDYSFDLNVLPLLVDTRVEAQLAMNLYGQFAGVTGSRYPYFLADTDYSYNYMFDADDRLAQIVQTPATLKPEKQDTYWFMIHYGE
jgi:hypothetical protein